MKPKVTMYYEIILKPTLGNVHKWCPILGGGDQKSDVREGQKWHQKIEQEVVKKCPLFDNVYTIENVNAGG